MAERGKIRLRSKREKRLYWILVEKRINRKENVTILAENGYARRYTT